MPTNVPLPALGESVTEGTISRWLKQVGDTVEADEALVEISTDKVDTELPSPVSGTVLEILAAEDDTVEVGATLAVIGEPGEGSGGDAGADDAEAGDAQDAEEQAAPEDPSAAEQQPAAQPESGSAGGNGGNSGQASGTEVTLPALGESVTEGTVSRWLKQVGDTVEADEALVEISTDKVDTELPSPAAGTLLEIKVNEDETAEVGAVLAIIGSADAAGGDKPAAQPEQPKKDDASSQPDDDADGPDAEAGEPPLAREGKPSTEAEDEGEAPKPGGEPTTGGGAESGTEVTLPALGESVTEGTVSRWLKQVGDTVEADEALVEISTDKVDTELPSPAAGTLLEIKVNEDETAEVGAVLAIIGSADAAGGDKPAAQPEQPKAQPEPKKEPEPKKDEPEKPEPAEQDEPKPSQAEATHDVSPAGEVSQGVAKADDASSAPRRATPDSEVGYVTPLVRKLAAQHGVDLASVTGSGVGGRLLLGLLGGVQHVGLADASAPKAPAAAATPQAGDAAASSKRGTTEKVTRLRSTIARRMVESLQVSAQLTATVEVDLTVISRIRAQAKDDFKAREGASLSYLPFITKAAVEGLKQFPVVNAQIDTEAGQITYADAEHIGIAVDTEKGLLVPVIADAGDLNVTGLAKKIADLAARTRASKVTPDELTGGTFTITNYGSTGTLFDTPIINQPQVAILGTGALVKRPVVVKDPNLGEVIAIRDMMHLSLSYDHRLVDGADASRYLSFVKQRLEAGDFGAEFGL